MGLGEVQLSCQKRDGASRLQINNLPGQSMLTSFHETSAERHADLIAKRHVFTGNGSSAEWKKNTGQFGKMEEWKANRSLCGLCFIVFVACITGRCNL